MQAHHNCTPHFSLTDIMASVNVVVRDRCLRKMLNRVMGMAWKLELWFMLNVVLCVTISAAYQILMFTIIERVKNKDVTLAKDVYLVVSASVLVGACVAL